MSDNVILRRGIVPVAQTAYFSVFDDDDGDIWSTSAAAFQAAGSVVNYANAMSSVGGSSQRIGTFPNAILPGIYTISIREQAGASPDLDADTEVAVRVVYWDGTDLHWPSRGAGGMFDANVTQWQSNPVQVDSVNDLPLVRLAAVDEIIARTTIASLTNQTTFTLTEGPPDNDAIDANAIVIIQDAVTSAQKSVRRAADYIGASKTLVLDLAPAFTIQAGDHVTIMADTAGTGAALTQQQIRDALKLAPSAGSPAAGSIDEHLDAIVAKTGLLTFTGGAVHSHVLTMATGSITAAALANNSLTAAAFADDVADEIRTEIFSQVMTESYATDGAAATLPQILYMIYSAIAQTRFDPPTGNIETFALNGTDVVMTFATDSLTDPLERRRSA